jgi:hypothetical protein
MARDPITTSISITSCSLHMLALYLPSHELQYRSHHPRLLTRNVLLSQGWGIQWGWGIMLSWGQ